MHGKVYFKGIRCCIIFYNIRLSFLLNLSLPCENDYDDESKMEVKTGDQEIQS